MSAYTTVPWYRYCQRLPWNTFDGKARESSSELLDAEIKMGVCLSKTTFPCLIRPDDVKVAVKPATAKSAEKAAAEKAAAQKAAAEAARWPSQGVRLVRVLCCRVSAAVRAAGRERGREWEWVTGRVGWGSPRPARCCSFVVAAPAIRSELEGLTPPGPAVRSGISSTASSRSDVRLRPSIVGVGDFARRLGRVDGDLDAPTHLLGRHAQFCAVRCAARRARAAGSRSNGAGC